MEIASPALLDPDLAGRAIVWLDDPSAGELALVGAKAASLSRLLRADFHVPAGFVVTSMAFQEATAEAEARGNLALATSVPKIAVTPQLAIAIVEAYQCLEPVGTAVAVRSSITTGRAEPHPTFTWISGRDRLLEAVHACWVSLRSHEEPSIAVVVQRMVDADRAGVAFSADPVTGDRTRVDPQGSIRVEATFGLGEGVVSGEAEPDTYLLDAASMQVRSVHGGRKSVMYKRGSGGHTVKRSLPASQAALWTLTDDEAAQVGRLASEVADLYGRPMKIEWAFDDDELWILQAHPTRP